MEHFLWDYGVGMFADIQFGSIAGSGGYGVGTVVEAGFVGIGNAQFFAGEGKMD